MNSAPRSIKTLLHTANPDLGIILRHADYLQRIRVAITHSLPDAAARHVHVADITPPTLILHTDNAGWATRLRYADPIIRRALAQQMRLHIEQVRVRVRPSLAQSETTPTKRHISAANRDYMTRIAEHVSDAELAQALAALARQGDD